MARAFACLRRREVLALVGVAMALGRPAALRAARAAELKPEELVQGLAKDVWATLQNDAAAEEQRVDALVSLFEARTDAALLGRLALGRYWNRLSDDQQRDYLELFRQVVIRSMARRLNQYAKDATGPVEERFQILSSVPAGKRDTLVRSKVFPTSGPPLVVDWRVRQGDAEPLIIDLIVEGASLLVAQRSEFAAVIERQDVDGLLTELRARAKSSRS